MPGLPVLNPPIVDVQPPQCPVPPTAAEIAAELKKDAAFIASLKGADGAPGKDGVNGKDGQTPELDLDDLAHRVADVLLQDASFVALTKGDTGAPGKDGTDAQQPDIDTLLTDLEKRLPPLRIQTLNPDGSIRDDVLARLGDLVRLRALVVKAEGQ
uniref:Tail protein n=1 Tax=viral metagenome TaxID=1070528 RepID=A0A6M3JHP4_9ZZZZ